LISPISMLFPYTTLFRSVFGDGSQTRSFCYVSDLIDGIFKLAMSSFHEPVNLGNPREMTIKQFAAEIIRITGTKSAIEYKPLPRSESTRLNSSHQITSYA